MLKFGGTCGGNAGKSGRGGIWPWKCTGFPVCNSVNKTNTTKSDILKTFIKANILVMYVDLIQNEKCIEYLTLMHICKIPTNHN